MNHPQFDLGPLHGPPTVLKIEALPASDYSASLARRCRAKASRVFDALVEKERSLISTRTRQALAAATEVTAGVFAFSSGWPMWSQGSRWAPALDVRSGPLGVRQSGITPCPKTFT